VLTAFLQNFNNQNDQSILILNLHKKCNSIKTYCASLLLQNVAKFAGHSAGCNITDNEPTSKLKLLCAGVQQKIADIITPKF
jgi:hypothetical protein